MLKMTFADLKNEDQTDIVSDGVDAPRRHLCAKVAGVETSLRA